MPQLDLLNKDCMEVFRNLPDESIDLFLTDPPYRTTARGTKGTAGGMFKERLVNKGKLFENNDLDISQWLPEAYRVLKQDTHCYVMTNNKNISHYLQIIQEQNQFRFVKNLIWMKDNKIMGNSYMSQFEYVIFLRKGRHRKINFCGTSDILQFPNKKLKNPTTNQPFHVTEKPIAMMEVLIKNSSNSGDVVFDPFMGIGATGIAARNLGRGFIGVELDKAYYDVACDRMNENDTLNG